MCFRGAAADEKWEEWVVSEYLGVYSKSTVTCDPMPDAKYVEDLRNKGTSPQEVQWMVSWVKQGRNEKERRGLEYFQTYFEKCWIPHESEQKVQDCLGNKLFSYRSCMLYNDQHAPSTDSIGSFLFS